MNKEKTNITIVGEHVEMLSWFPINITKRTVIKGLTFAEVKSKGLALIYKEETGKEAKEGSLTSYHEIQYPKRNDIAKD